MLGFGRQRGDTLVEVMLATVVLSVVVVGAFSLMNKGIATSYGVLERTEVRSHLTRQIELVTYFRDRYAQTIREGAPTTEYPASVWSAIIAKSSAAASSTDPNQCVANDGFYLANDGAGTEYSVRDYTHVTPSGIPAAGSGVWLEATRSDASVAVPYVDVYVKACWDAVEGGGGTMSSTVRLYDQ